VVVFINLIVVHCQDLLDVSALCAASISGIVTAAAAIAPFGAAVHAGCAKGSILKANPVSAAKGAAISSLYTVPTIKHRRLKAVQEMKDAMAGLKEIRQNLEAKLGFNASLPSLYSEADMEKMIQLIDDGVTDDSQKWSMRGSSDLTDDECEE
ncbi:unnamed protein product, partial [Symbiodinium pilosum]